MTVREMEKMINKLGRNLTGIATVLRYLLTNPRLLRKLLSATYKGYLLKEGWVASVRAKMAMDAEGRPFPWLTYPMIHLLNERLTREMTVFEYGGGNSTLYFGDRVRDVTTVEHNPEWHAYLKSKARENCRVLFQELEYDGAYCRTAAATGKRFDIIVVDGRDRVNCARHALSALSERGVIIFDDFERERYQETKVLLAAAGFRQLNFWGMKPGLLDGANTALFYRADNLFGI